MSVETPHHLVLPTEIIDHIIKYLIPSNDPLPIAFPRSHSITKTLLNLTRTSRVTYLEAVRLLYAHCLYIEAVRLLYAHCLYIDTPERLHGLSITVTIMAGRIPSHFTDLPLIHCNNYPPSRPHPTLPKVDGIRNDTRRERIVNQAIQNQTARLPTLPHFQPHKHIKSLYLQPFEQIMIFYGRSHDLDIAHSIHDLVSLIATTLQRLVVDIRSKKLDPENDPFCIRMAMRDAFLQCTSLEYFCSLRDDFFLQTYFGDPRGRANISPEEPPVWDTWKNLQTLIVHNNDVSDGLFWTYLRLLPDVTTVVMVRPESLRWTDIYHEWLKGARDGEVYDKERKITIFLVGIEDDDRWDSTSISSADERISINYIDVPNTVKRKNIDMLCREWAKERVLADQDPTDWDDVTFYLQE